MQHFLCTGEPQAYTNSQNSTRPKLGENITFPLIVLSMPAQGAYIEMSFCPGISKLGVSKFSKLGLLQFWRRITFCVDRLKWGLKQSCKLRRKPSKGMWHTTYTQANHNDSWLLIIEGQIVTFFCHNLCFKYPNGSCMPIFDIFVSRAFPWYKKTFQSNEFWPLKSLSKNSKVHWDSNSENESPFTNVWVHS